MAGTTTRFEDYCTHCRAGVLSRDSLVMVKGERLCLRCCQAHEEMEARIRRLSGPLLLASVVIGGSLGYVVAKGVGVIPWIGLFPGVVVGLVAAGLIEGLLRRY
ncbi:MAG TPA: hypothetical protein PLY56_07010 [Armatimonadota bacterium]|jgi:hypothetical protein|nr:hypothetical protein [Armatimonadota bacterium]HOJ21265.1 hypothetical protein [Armatimonadota bacterium]HOM81814.1 hypothetical protein [Armatimonadota bacterium]HPO74410.1 hypothetical protein [Armatimonadota bacterium]